MATKGRPSSYTEAIAAEVCARMSAGETLRQICRDEHLPSEAAIRLWAAEDREGFSARYARAREILVEHWADQIVSISDETQIGVETTTKGDGGVETREGDMLGHRKLQIDTRKWLLSKLRPDKYGDKLELSGDPKKPLVPIINVTIAPKSSPPPQAGNSSTDDGD